MKLIRYGAAGRERPGLILKDGTYIDASDFGVDYDEAFFGGDGLTRLAAWAAKKSASARRLTMPVRLGPCIARPSKIICIGLKYLDHAAGGGLGRPQEP